MTSLWMVCMKRKKVWNCNKFKKMKCPCNRWVLVTNHDTSKEIVHFVHEVHPVFAVTLCTFLHMLCGWNYDTIPTFNFFRVHLKCFHVLWFKVSCVEANGSICQEGGVQVDPQYGMTTVDLNNLGYTDEPFVLANDVAQLLSETLILRKWLSILYTKCIKFLS